MWLIMSNYTDCPNCAIEIDATAASLTGYCPECDTAFSELVATEAPDPGNAGPYYEVDTE